MLLSASGKVLGRHRIQGERATWMGPPWTWLAASPSGRFVAVNLEERDRIGRIALMDLRASTHRIIEVPGSIRGAAWSPSGRRLAIVCLERRLFTFEA